MDAHKLFLSIEERNVMSGNLLRSIRFKSAYKFVNHPSYSFVIAYKIVL